MLRCIINWLNAASRFVCPIGLCRRAVRFKTTYMIQLILLKREISADFDIHT